jgi:MFS family permease
MSETKPMNRWRVAIGAILIQLCLGAIYAWSVFTTVLKKPVVDGGYGFTTGQTQWIFSVGLATFAVVMVLAGRLMGRFGPRALAMVGCPVLGIGYVLGALLGDGLVAQILCIGLIGGAGIGIGYVVPIAVGIKWFPDKKGLISGLAVAGFGFGALIWVKVAGGVFGWAGLMKTISLFGLDGLRSTWLVYGGVFAVVGLLGATVMVNPPAGYCPAGWTPPAPSAKTGSGGMVDMRAAQVLCTPQFYFLFLSFMLSAMAGLMVIGVIKLFGTDALVASGAVVDGTTTAGEPISAKTIAGGIADWAMAIYAILNGLGRIAWGMTSDKIGRKASLVMMCILQGVIMLLFYKMGATPVLLILAAAIIGFNFGGNFALFPAATADTFGNKTVGVNYPMVFLSYGVAGILGPQLAGFFQDRACGDVTAWLMPFVIAGVGCIVAAVIAGLLRPPRTGPPAKTPADVTTRRAPTVHSPPAASDLPTRKAGIPPSA